MDTDLCRTAIDCYMDDGPNLLLLALIVLVGVWAVIVGALDCWREFREWREWRQIVRQHKHRPAECR